MLGNWLYQNCIAHRWLGCLGSVLFLLHPALPQTLVCLALLTAMLSYADPCLSTRYYTNQNDTVMKLYIWDTPERENMWS